MKLSGRRLFGLALVIFGLYWLWSALKEIGG